MQTLLNPNFLKYWAILTGPLIISLSFIGHGWWAWIAVLYVFVLIPILELILPYSTSNMSEAEEKMALADPFYDYLVWFMVPLQYILLYYFLHAITEPGLTLFEMAGRTIGMGIACSVLGINVAHELGHRSTKHEQWMSKALLLTSLYMHFFIEHNRGHHKNVATAEDPASADRGEIVYLFWFKSVFFGYISAWKLEAKRLEKKKQAFWSIHNEMIWYQVIQLIFIGLIYYFFGWVGTINFIIAAIIGFLLLETVNYVEHYGLRRQKKENGYYERVMPVHSWNSNHTVGRILLFELTRHSDHHYKASRKYQVLRHFEEAPQMPTGYPGMVVLSLFPPLWFYIMHRHIDQYKQKYGEVLA